MMRVAVVGAGFAGLAAADALARAGAEVIVFEARDRVGGRVWSRRLENGALVEMGAEFVLPGASTLEGLVDRLGLDFWDKGMFYGDREPRGGIGVDPVQLHAATEAIAAAFVDRPDGPLGMSARSFLDGLDLHPGAREAIEARLEISCVSTADRIDATALGGLAAHSHDACPSIAGGNQSIALALAEQLGATLRLRSPVDRIAWREDGASVSAAGAEVEVDLVVLALPATVVGRIAFSPALPESLAKAYADVELGHAAKLFVPLMQTPGPTAVMAVAERYWTWTATADGVVQPVLHAFAGSAPALAGLDVAEGAETWLASVTRLRPELQLDPGGVILSTWADDPWVAAAYSTRVPPAQAWAPAGPFHVCGEHTAGDLHALMEGALRSGVRAAEEILSRRAPRP
jgi:monoamine oxidase